MRTTWANQYDRGQRNPTRQPEGTCPRGGAGVCACATPTPTSGLGECAWCARPVVTFMRLSGEDPADVWPALHARAVAAGATPEVWAERVAARNAEATG